VKDQKCGDCYAHAATEALETAYAIKHGSSPKVYSVQQNVDCVDGFNGGLEAHCYKYLQTHYESLNADYPYAGGKKQTCKYNETTAKKSGCKVSSSGHTSKSVSTMKSQISKQSLSVGVNADSRAWGNYKAGTVIRAKDCGGSSMNHSVVIEGWGHDSTSGLDYWLVRNSWGTSYGDKGYAKLEITDGNGTCLINEDVTWPTVM